MARFCALYSGSSGNSLYISSGGSALLVDAGVSCKAILTALCERQIDPGTIQGILVTHEHVDHVRGLRVLLKKLPVPVYGSQGTLAAIAEQVQPHTDLRVIDSTMEIGGQEVTPFATPHDAAQPLGYRICTGDQRTVGVATDLGHVTPEVQTALSGCDLVAIEANYDEGMLRCGCYPYSLKRRIQSECGHLSNDACATQSLQLVQQGTTRLVLGHLSRENNTPTLADQAVAMALTAGGCVQGQDYILQVARRSQPSPMIIF